MSTESQSLSRRGFLVSAAAAGATALTSGISLNPSGASAQIAPVPLDPTTLKQFETALPNPLSPQLPGVHLPKAGSSFTMSINETYQVLGKRKNNGGDVRTRVWGYGLSTGNGVAYPGPTFEVQRGAPISITFKNDLLGIPNRMPVDTTLDWANPGSVGGLTPVPVVAHLHGARSQYLSDGLPEAWATPGNNQKGRLFSTPYQYDNDQEAGHLWYHDHALGITRTNVYMGLAGFYFIRDDNENALRAANVLPSFPYEVPIVIQDRQFTSDGNLFYPSEDTTYVDFAPTHLPEFFGDIILVNGQIWPKLQVEQRKYRFRILNGSDSRFYALQIQQEGKAPGAAASDPTTPAGSPLKIMVIGNELGLLNTPANAFWYSPPDPAVRGAMPNTPGGGISQADTLLIGPGERYDVVIDFSAVPVGTRLLLWNGAASPYNGQPADGADYVAPTPGLSDRVMAFDVVARNAGVPNASIGPNTILRRTTQTPPMLTGPLLDAFAKAVVPRRKILLVEGTDTFGRLQTMIGTVGPNPQTDGTFNFKDPITEFPTVGRPEIWEFHNTTADAHPIHMHLVDFRVLDRQAFTGTTGTKTNTDGSQGATLSKVKLTGPAIKAEPWQSGKKDTVVAYPGYITRVLVNFTRPGEYVYHCHILSHEDHEMMRKYEVRAAVATAY